MDIRRCILTFVIVLFMVESALQACFKARVSNGRVKLRRRGKMAIYRCRRGFRMYGSKVAVCLQNEWSHPPPKCIAPGCPAVPPSEGLVIKPAFNSSKMSFSCEESYKLQGPTEIFCDKIHWDKPPPVCLATSSMMSCDFEQPDLCGWTQSTEDDFDWIRNSLQTPSGYTGPSFDHTYGQTKQGHYMYIETSSPRKPGHAADLRSPIYLPEQSDQCFDLWYHMLGPDGENVVGSLDIYVKPRSVNLADLSPTFHEQGNKGDRWIRVEITVPPLDESFQIVVVAKRLESYVSDIAIDDVRLFNCSEVYYENVTAEAYTSTQPSSTTPTNPPTTATITIRRPSTTPQPTTSPITRRPSQSPSRPATQRQTTASTVKKRTSRPTTISVTPRATTTPAPRTRRPRTTSSKTKKTTASTTMSRSTKLTTTMRPTRRPWTRRPRTRKPWTRKPKVTKPRSPRTKTTTTPVVSTAPIRLTNASSSAASTGRTTATTATSTASKSRETTTTDSTVLSDNRTTKFNMFGNITASENKSTEVTPGSEEPTGIHKTIAGNTSPSEVLPLVIGIIGSVVFVIIVIVILAVVWAKKKRRREIEPYDEMEPITKSVSKTSLNLNLVNDYDIMDNE